MDPVFVPLLTAAIGFAGKVISAIVSRPAPQINTQIITQVTNVEISSSATAETHPGRQEEVNFDFKARTQVRALDKRFLNEVIDKTTKHFDSLLALQTEQLTSEVRAQANRVIRRMEYQRYEEAIHEVQAHVAALKTLLDWEELEPALTIQLVVNALNPLQVSLEKARLRFESHPNKEAWLFCEITGTSALMAGYAFLGQDTSRFRYQVEQKAKDVQREMLNAVAFHMLSRNAGDFPWEQVPALLLPEKIEDLAGLYQSTVGGYYDLRNMNIAGIKEAIATIEDESKLREILSEEEKHKNRPGAIKEIKARLSALSADLGSYDLKGMTVDKAAKAITRTNDKGLLKTLLEQERKGKKRVTVINKLRERMKQI